MKSSWIKVLSFILVISLIIWNIWLNISLRKFKSHPELIEIFIEPNSELEESLQMLKDSFNVSIVVPDYENNQLSQTIGVLGSTFDAFNLVLSALGIFLAILAALGLYEINTWRNIRNEILEGEEKVHSLTERINEKIKEIDSEKTKFDIAITEIDKASKKLQKRIDDFNLNSQKAQENIDSKIELFSSKQKELLSNYEQFRVFRDGIITVFNEYRHQIKTNVLGELKKVERANYEAREYPEKLKSDLKDYLKFYKNFGSLLESFSNEELPLEYIDYFALGMAAFLDGNIQLAKAFFEKSVEINENNYLANFRLGAIHLVLNELEEAINYFNITLNIKPNFPEAHYNKGITFYKQQKYSEAVIEFEKTIAISSKYLEAYNNLAGIYIIQEEYEKAERALDELIELDNTFHRAFYNKACLYSKRKNKIGALHYLEKAISFDKSLAVAAKQDAYFVWLKEDNEFIRLIENS